MEDYDKIKKVLALGFMHFLDENRTEGKMCLSNGECADIEKVFNEQDWPKLVRYLDKYHESEDERIRKEINALYSEIDTCITELLKARTDKDSEAEGKALFKMEGLMVATLQDLSCIEDYLEKQKEDYSSFSEEQRKYMEKYIPLDKVILVKLLAERDENTEAILRSFENKEEQKEQKPAEWNEEDKTMINHIIEALPK